MQIQTIWLFKVTIKVINSTWHLYTYTTSLFLHLLYFYFSFSDKFKDQSFLMYNIFMQIPYIQIYKNVC